MIKDKIKKLIKESIAVKEKLIIDYLDEIEEIINLCLDTLKNGGKIIFCGNGGSAADSQHLAAEFVVRFKKDRKSLAAIALTANTSIITAIGNDYGYPAIFSRQLESLADKNDLLIAITTSGKSENVIRAVKKAKQIGMKTIAFTGANGGDLAKQCDSSIAIPSTDTARIQEAHISIGHIICELIDEKIT